MKLHFIKNWTGSVLAYNPEGEPYNYERLRNQRVIWIQSLNSKPQPFKYRRTNFKGKSMVYSHSWKDVPAPGTIFNPRTEDKWIERSGMCVVKKIEEFSSNVGYELLVKEINEDDDPYFLSKQIVYLDTEQHEWHDHIASLRIELEIRYPSI